VPARLGGYGDTVIREHRQDERVDLTIVGRPHATLDGDNSESNPGVVVTFAGSVSRPLPQQSPTSRSQEATGVGYE